MAEHVGEGMDGGVWSDFLKNANLKNYISRTMLCGI